MGKTTKALALTAGIAGAAGLAALATTPDQVSASTGTVTYQDGATTVWQTPAFSQAKRYVLYNQQIEIKGQKTVNGTTWYQIGANEWIPEVYLSVSGATKTTAAPAATAVKTGTSQPGSFNLTVTYTAGATTVWGGPSYTAPTGRYLTAGQTVKAVAKTTNGGEVWYRLSNGGYVPARFASANGAAAVTTTPAKTATPAKTTTTTPAKTTTTPAATVTTPAKTTTPATTTTTPAKTETPAADTTTPAKTETPAKDTTTPAQPSTPAKDTTTPAKTETPSTPVTAGSYTLTVANSGSVVTVWTTAAYTKANGTYLADGQTVKANGKTTVGGEVWYRLTSGGFIPARFTKTGTTATTPAQPSTPAKDTTTPAKPTTPTTPTTPAKPTTPTVSRSAKIEAIIKLARQQIGKPYAWGSKGPSSFDCSGLMYYVFKNAAGITLGGYTGSQQYNGTRVSVANAQRGDLIFWATAGTPYHVALYLGNGQYIHSPQPGETVTTAAISTYFAPSFAVRVF